MSMPRGWATARLEDVVVERVLQAEPSARPVPYIDIGAIDRERKSIGERQSVTGSTAPTRARQWVKTGDVLVSMTRPNLNAVALVPKDLDGAVASTGFDVLRPVGVLPQWIFYRVRSHAFVQDVCQGVQGVVYPAIRPADVRRHQLPIPPAAEQARIVEALDSHLSRLDAAVTSLQRAQAKLKAYRASVLKAAVEGRLVPTEAELARSEGRSYEPADVLLERILTERRRRWEDAELAKMKVADKTPKDDKWRTAYREPVPLDATTFPTLPEGWCWATTDQLFSFVTSGSRGWAQYYSQSGPLFIRIGNLDHDSISLDLADVQHVSPPPGSEGLRTRVAPGDVLVSITADVGMIAVVPEGLGEAYINQHISLARPAGGLVIAYLAWFLAAPQGGQRQFLSLQRGATKVGLGLDDIRSVAVPLPPLAEQHRIVDTVEASLVGADSASSSAKASIRRCARLRQSLLSWAFEGKLVDRDPGDEPADALLARIRDERASAAPSTPKAKRSGKLKVAS